MTLEELKALYKEKGATQQLEEVTEAGTKYYDAPVNLGDDWYAFENDNRKIIDYIGQGMDATPVYDDAPKTLGGFSKQEGDYITDYDLQGNAIARRKWNESDLKTMWNDLGPIIMGAATMGGGAGALGSYLFPSLSATAAAGAGGALLGGANAAFTDQDILKGALLGGVGSAGALELGDTGFKLGDVKKAYDFIQNPSLAGVVNAASPYVGSTQIGDTGMSIGDIFKNVGTAKALTSGDEGQIFKALTGLARDQGGSLKSSLAGFDANPEDFIEGYFQPGGEGYIDPTRQDITVSEQPQNLDALLRELSPYATDEGKSVFTQTEDIPEFETVDKRPITSIESILGTPDILQSVEADVPELTITDDREKEYVPGIRTKEIKSDIPDEITIDQIDKLFPDLNINDILQTITPGGTKVVAPGGTKTTTPGTQSVQKSLANLGLGDTQQAASQDPYADIKLMEEMFGPDIAYKLLSLGGNKRK
jgi:hypothetical protein